MRCSYDYLVVIGWGTVAAMYMDFGRDGVLLLTCGIIQVRAGVPRFKKALRSLRHLVAPLALALSLALPCPPLHRSQRTV